MSLTIAAADIVAQLRRRFGIRGDTGITLEETILTTANIADLDNPPWHSKRGFVCSATSIAVAAQNSYVIAISQNCALGTAYVIRRIYLSTGAASNVRIGVLSFADWVSIGGFSVGAPTGSWDSVDDQLAVAQNISVPLAIGGGASAVALLGLQNSLSIPLNTFATVEGPFVLRRNAALFVQNTTLNQQLTVALYGDEYQPE